MTTPEGPAMLTRSCPHCGAANAVASDPTFCAACGHQVGVHPYACTCESCLGRPEPAAPTLEEAAGLLCRAVRERMAEGHDLGRAIPAAVVLVDGLLERREAEGVMLSALLHACRRLVGWEADGVGPALEAIRQIVDLADRQGVSHG